MNFNVVGPKKRKRNFRLRLVSIWPLRSLQKKFSDPLRHVTQSFLPHVRWRGVRDERQDRLPHVDDRYDRWDRTKVHFGDRCTIAASAGEWFTYDHSTFFAVIVWPEMIMNLRLIWRGEYGHKIVHKCFSSVYVKTRMHSGEHKQ